MPITKVVNTTAMMSTLAKVFSISKYTRKFTSRAKRGKSW